MCHILVTKIVSKVANLETVSLISNNKSCAEVNKRAQYEAFPACGKGLAILSVHVHATSDINIHLLTGNVNNKELIRSDSFIMNNSYIKTLCKIYSIK